MLIFPLHVDNSRKIIHIDMDAFFASIEQRDNPELRGKPVIIAQDPRLSGGRGVVSTCSYEARVFGVHSAMSAIEALELCPQGIFVSGHYDKYVAVSQQVREIFGRYSELVQAASIDEAYLDVTENKIGAKSAMRVAKLIQHDIWTELHLTCSAGVSYNKFLAKIASDWEKPHGLTLIAPDAAKDFLAKLPVEKFHGVGKATVPKLHELGIFTGGDLQEANPLDLAERFGVYGWELYLKANGIHESRVISSRERKSVGKERTYSQFLHGEAAAKRELERLSERVAKSLQSHRLKGNIVVVKLRYEDFTTLTKRKSLSVKFDDAKALTEAASEIFDSIEPSEKGIRLLGVTVSGFEPTQASLEEASQEPLSNVE
ncbi:MAG: DNA polymerase IV [Streptococcaceae bacterium]|jgi:DNA polymerase-4|nr:DNA polymerase IV [Streptococcaceae bacterium]